MTRRFVANAFGRTSPSCNMEFPSGNLTAAEIVAYFPHWLKSVDVIDRFIMNGGGLSIISSMINEFRILPDNVSYSPISLLVMLRYAMKRGFHESWTVRNHLACSPHGESEWDEGTLDVTNFRTPRITHPRAKNAAGHNLPAAPIEFRLLAQDVKKHPSGSDALDLSRCIAYAIQNPHEIWLFPQDFERLVNALGGPRPVTTDHWDTAVFTRRSTNPITPLKSRVTTAPTTSFGLSGQAIVSENDFQESELNHRTSATMPLTRSKSKISSGAPSTPQKPARLSSLNDAESMRTNSRLAKKLSYTTRGADFEDVSPSKADAQERSAGKKRSIHEDFEPEPYDDEQDGEFEIDEEYYASLTSVPYPESVVAVSPPTGTRYAAKKARVAIHALATSPHKAQPLPPPHKSKSPSPIDPEITAAARAFPQRVPTLLKPPVLNPDRLVVDEYSVLLYAEEGAKDLWASAMSSTRFNGPRRHPPFRELYRLTDPKLEDASDWAENIRWAKEQYKYFGSATWTEYDYHLEIITDHRRETHWVSEEAIKYGVLNG